DLLARRDMREVRADESVRVRAPNLMTAGTSARHEDVTPAPFDVRFWIARRPTHLGAPGVELRFGLGHHVERHVGVLLAAELRALAAERARAVCLHPDRGDVAGNQIAFALEIRCPEAVNDVTRLELEDDRPPDGNVDFVRGDEAVARDAVLVLDFPPPL